MWCLIGVVSVQLIFMVDANAVDATVESKKVP